jgi:hypothetical protein
MIQNREGLNPMYPPGMFSEGIADLITSGCCERNELPRTYKLVRSHRLLCLGRRR